MRKFMIMYKVIEDRAVSQELNCSLQQVKNSMQKLIRKQDKKRWVIIPINDHYIFFNDIVINDFINLYKNGHNEKQIFESINRNEEIFKSRREVKILEDELMRQRRIFKRKGRIEDEVTIEFMD
jgi:hypothetical protein